MSPAVIILWLKQDLKGFQVTGPSTHSLQKQTVTSYLSPN